MLPLGWPPASRGCHHAPSTSGDAVLPRLQDKDGQKQCVARNAFRGQGVYAIARCCTWPRAQCRISTSSVAAEGVGCSSRDHVLTGNARHGGLQSLEPASRWPRVFLPEKLWEVGVKGWV